MVTFSQGVLESHHGQISERFSFQSERLDEAERSKQAGGVGGGVRFVGVFFWYANNNGTFCKYIYMYVYGIYNLYMLCICIYIHIYIYMYIYIYTY